MSLGPWELLIILLIVIALFGASKIATLGSAVGGSIREFKKAVRDDEATTPEAQPVEDSSTAKLVREAELSENNGQKA
jgi:sec-independent protein translocase protein TatA